MIIPAGSTESGLQHSSALEPRREYGADREELLVPELWRMLRTRYSLIVGCAVAGLLLAAFYVLVRSPRYEAEARIEVSPVGTNSMGLDEVTSRMLTPSDPTIQLQSAVTVLQSKTIAMAVMQQTRLAERNDFAGSWTQPAGSDVDSLAPMVRDRLLKRFKKNLEIEVVPKTDILSVRFRAKDAKLAADVVNATVSSYAERNFRSSYDSAAQVSNWLSAQMEDLKLKANSDQEKLAALQKKRGLIGVDETDNVVVDKLKELDEQLTETESDRIVKEARYRIAGSGNPELIASSIPEPTLQVLRSQQAELRVEYARMSTKFGEGYPKLAELGNQMSQVDSAINAELKNLAERYKNDYLAAANAEKMLRAKVDQQKQKAFDLNQDAAQYAILKHEVEGTQDLYQTLQLKLKQAGVVAGLASANIAVVEAGQVAAEPVDPRPALDLLLGFGGGLGLGVLSAAGLEALDNSIRTGEEAERDSALPTLAVIPQISRAESRAGDRDFPESAPDLLLIAHYKPSSSAAESFRNLRTALQTRHGVEPPKTIVVTSSSPSEGKTLTAISCAIVLAQQGARVLLVDADLRQPSIHAAFGVARDPGLSNLLTANSPAKQVITPSKVFANLSLLTAGAACAYPAEMLASSEMLEQLAQWRTEYDHIVLDTPPVCMFTDAVVLGSQADAAVLVVRAGVTTGYAVRHTRDLLQRADVAIAGVVLNGADARYERSYYRTYGYRFGGKNGRHFDS